MASTNFCMTLNVRGLSCRAISLADVTLQKCTAYLPHKKMRGKEMFVRCISAHKHPPSQGSQRMKPPLLGRSLLIGTLGLLPICILLTALSIGLGGLTLLS
jgi:hypothetical protein